ncbi:MAG: chemotaxis protein CheW [Chromatiales bacterium]|nr:chemotaxis protein CheW [Chromatiales bacterium]
MASEAAVVESGQYLSFMLSGEDYGIDILKVQEIKGWEEVRPLPDTPEYVKGVLDFRGIIVPIIDLRSRFNLTSVEYTPTTVTIVVAIELNGQSHVMGIVVDGVSDVLDVSEGDIRNAPNLGSQINTRYIQGMVNFDERMVILLDLNKLLNPEELGVLDIVS